jgi:hypothetical protein
MNSYRTVTKQASPGTSKELDYIVSIYHNSKFKVAYRYKDWTGDAVSKEIELLEIRFPSSNGWKIDCSNLAKTPR